MKAQRVDSKLYGYLPGKMVIFNGKLLVYEEGTSISKWSYDSWKGTVDDSNEKTHQEGGKKTPLKGIVWSNYSDLTRPHPKWWFSMGNPLISGKSRLVKYYNLARIVLPLVFVDSTIFKKKHIQKNPRMFLGPQIFWKPGEILLVNARCTCFLSHC